MNIKYKIYIAIKIAKNKKKLRYKLLKSLTFLTKMSFYTMTSIDAKIVSKKLKMFNINMHIVQ